MNVKEVYESRTYLSNSIIKRKFVDKLKNVSDLKILEVGCGVADISQTLADKNDVHGIDLSVRNVKIAKSNGIKAVVHDAENKFPYRSNTFDVVICSEVMEHLFNPGNTVKESYRVLKGGSIAFINTQFLFIN